MDDDEIDAWWESREEKPLLRKKEPRYVRLSCCHCNYEWAQLETEEQDDCPRCQRSPCS